MDDPALAHKLKAFFLAAAGLLVATLLAWNIGSQNYKPLLLGAVVVVVACVALFSGRFFWVLTIASSFLSGTFPILGGAFTPFQILIAIGVVKFLIGDVVLKRTRLKVGNRFDALMIAGFMGILTWHGVHDRFGMRFLGSTVWGGHNYVNVYVGLVAFFVVQSIPINPKIWAKLPYVVLAVTSFDLIIAVITTISPASIYAIYPFYSAVSSTSLEEIVTGSTLDVTGRIGTFGSFGLVLIMWCLASMRVTQILHPKNFFRVVGLAVGFASTLFSGFRSAVINGLIGFFTAGIRDLKWAVLFLVPIFGVLLFMLSAVNSQVFHLPKQMQRGLAFLPGDWDADMAHDAAGSNEFRRRLWTLWTQSYFPEQPWFGRGFGFRSEWAKASASTYKKAVDYRQMVETGSIHNGLFAALDAFGIIGTVFFIMWNLRILLSTFQVSFGKHEASGTALRFLALYLAVWILSYWFGAQTIGLFLPLQFALVGVFLRLQQAVTSDAVTQHSVPIKSREVFNEELAST